MRVENREVKILLKIRKKLIFYHKTKIETLHCMQGEHSTTTRSYFSLYVFRALATSCVLYNRSEHSQGLILFNCTPILPPQSRILLIIISCDINSGTDKQYFRISLQCILLAFFILNSCSTLIHLHLNSHHRYLCHNS